MKNSRVVSLALPMLCALAVACSSCQLIGWTAAQLQPPEKVKPLYVPQAGDKRVLVFVDDRANQISYQPIKRMLTEEINSQLIEHKITSDVIAYERVLDLQANQQDFDAMSIVRIAQLAGADMVLHVDITSFRLKEDESSPLWDGTIETSVRWVDAHAKTLAEARLWPKSQANGHAVPAVTTPLKDVKEDTSATYATQVASTLAKEMAQRIVALFYEHTVQPGQEK